MGIFSGNLLRLTCERLQQDQGFLHDCRGLSGTILLQDEESCAYVTFYRGTLEETGLGHSIYGSDFRLLASAESWTKAFTKSNPAAGIYELSGVLLDFDGNQYTFQANAKAFYTFWQTLRKTFLEIFETEKGEEPCRK